tara:strand:- start:467 stop:874 length:408 start_codon:yes stop_codon:yes gene_type:complete
MERPSWDEYFQSIASLTARRSPCHRLKVGCVLVRENRIIAQGYNGFIRGAPHESIVVDGHEQATIHAEQNAIADCANRGTSCNGTTAYVTHYPCVNCCKILIASGISEIKYINDYKNDPLVCKLIKNTGKSITKI